MRYRRSLNEEKNKASNLIRVLEDESEWNVLFFFTSSATAKKAANMIRDIGFPYPDYLHPILWEKYEVEIVQVFEIQNMVAVGFDARSEKGYKDALDYLCSIL